MLLIIIVNIYWALPIYQALFKYLILHIYLTLTAFSRKVTLWFLFSYFPISCLCSPPYGCISRQVYSVSPAAPDRFASSQTQVHRMNRASFLVAQAKILGPELTLGPDSWFDLGPILILNPVTRGMWGPDWPHLS